MGPDTPPQAPLITQQFEYVVNTNAARGYRLHSWQLVRAVIGDNINETIVAVFEYVGGGAGQTKVSK